ncbi:MAG: C1 family peptidase [Planctomycetota bacterium]
MRSYTTRHSFFLSSSALLVLFAAGCGGGGGDSTTSTTTTTTTTSETPGPLGLVFLPSESYESIPTVDAPLMGTGDLPSEWDLSNNMPTPGDQERQSSCVGWAVAYAMKTYQERVERNWSLSVSAHLFSPAYIYNQINVGRYAGSDSGAYIYEALNILTSQGCATLATMPYNQSDFLTQPSTATKTEATQYKAVLWRTVNKYDRTEVKKWLYSNAALPAGIQVGMNFSRSNMAQTGYVYRTLGDKIPDSNGNLSYPGHAIALVGYSDTKSAFKLINSWGTSWGDNGYAWIDYDFFPVACREVYYVQDQIETETVSVPSRPSGPTSAIAYANCSYSAGEATSSLGHTVEYQFEWKGDGTDLSAWGSITQLQAWASAGTYSVRARARCTADTSVVSLWSSGFSVIISDVPAAENVSTPSQPAGSSSGYCNSSYSYSTGGSSSSLGHSLEYRFDWGDGNYSNWSSSSTASKTWYFAGEYAVKAQARCATDTSIVSEWSSGAVVTISEPSESGSVTFSYTGGTQTWTVPSGVTSIQVDGRGAQGGAGQGNGGSGGKGARVQTTLSVTPGATIYLHVGGKGCNWNTDGSFAGGYNGGGSGAIGGYDSGGGGGMSDIVIGGSFKVIAAGGGGGGGGDAIDYGGNGGGGGQTGTNGSNSTDGAGGGRGGTQSAGGAGGIGTNPGSPGSSYLGGTGGEGGWGAGGGGGGGLYGGGGGAWGSSVNGGGGGGGGGSSFSGGSGTSYASGYRSGNGQITITY